MRNRTRTTLATTAVAALLLAGCGTGSVPGTAGEGRGGPPGQDHGGGNGGNGDDDGAARNVILMVGDGMGAAARDLIRLGTVGLSGELEMDSLPVEGRAHTNSADPETFVTDSAAAATSMATGVKTYNGAIGMDLAQQPVPTALEVAEELGKATGLVTTSLVTDATPAAFGSHVLDRDEQSEIARQFLESSQPEVILGGGEDYWYPAGNPGAFPDNPPEDPSEESQGSAGNLVDRARELGYDYVTDADQLAAADGDRLLGLFANQEMFQYGDDVEEAYDPTVPLTEMTAKALDVLSAAEDGFFLLVEEEGIDSMAHVNDAALTLASGAQFDRAVGLARDFAEEDGETLVIVVGDHETGGLTIESLDDPENPDEGGDGPSAEDGPLDVANSDQQFLVDWTTEGHSAVDVPLTAMGPGSEELDGVYENTRIFEVMASAMRAGADDGGGDGGSGSPGVGQRQRFDLQSHRGGRGEYTEESLTAFARSLELGVSTLELDTHLTEDGRVVVWHDDTIQPEKCRDTVAATPGDAEYPYVGDRVADLTLAQVKTLDCGYQQLPGYPEQQVVEGNRIAELRDVYALAEDYGARKVRFNVETKVEDGQAGGPGMVALTEAVVAEVRAADAERRTTIQSFDWNALNLVQDIAPELRTVALADPASLGVGQPGTVPELGGIDIDDFGGSIVRAAHAQGYDVVSPIYTSVDEAMIRDARRLGLPVIPWTVNEEADMVRLIELGVAGLITDYPTRLRGVMEDLGLKLPRAYPAPYGS